MINAVAIAEKMFAEHGVKFTDVLLRCLLKGTVLSYQNEILWIGEPAFWDGEHLNDEVYEPMSWNCWFAHFLYAPKVSRRGILEMAPFYLPYTAWRRQGGQLRVYRTDRIVRGT